MARLCSRERQSYSTNRVKAMRTSCAAAQLRVALPPAVAAIAVIRAIAVFAAAVAARACRTIHVSNSEHSVRGLNTQDGGQRHHLSQYVLDSTQRQSSVHASSHAQGLYDSDLVGRSACFLYHSDGSGLTLRRGRGDEAKPVSWTVRRI